MTHRYRLVRDLSHARTTCPLNGEWEIGPGGRDHPPAVLSHRIQVPSVVDCASPPLTGREADFYWYRCPFEAQGIGDDDLVFLCIEQAQFGTEVRIDGVPVGRSIACYTSQTYDITDHIRPGRVQSLDIRIGVKDTLPPESAVGRDYEKTIYTPGIWGDVHLYATGRPRIGSIQVIPHIKPEEAEIRVTLDRWPDQVSEAEVEVEILEAASMKPAGRQTGVALRDVSDSSVVVVTVPVERCRLWSPDDPFLYRARVTTTAGGRVTDRTEVRFGMRTFGIDGNRFVLNGNPVYLKGGNIAFHRFLADPERAMLPWDGEWVRRMLIDIPKEHGFTFFRFHLGHAYNRWYDLADEHGMLIQDEWHFWTTTGSNAVITEEFRQWVKDNWNHPSIVIWDPLNESADDSLVHDVVPDVRRLDPTRPWESVDFADQHPYIYGLGMTLNDRRFGFTDSLTALATSSQPVVVNEFLWWWFDSDWKPTSLTEEVVVRWLGRRYSRDDIVRHQVYLVQELVGLFRRLRLAAIQPFVYLSNNNGPTAHWFEGPVANLRPKPVMAALKNAYAPFGLSTELWDRHFAPGTEVILPVHVFNDHSADRSGVVRVRFPGADGPSYEIAAHVPAREHVVTDIPVVLPELDGPVTIVCELLDEQKISAASWERTVYLLKEPTPPPDLPTPLVLDPAGEVTGWLDSVGVTWKRYPEGLSDARVVFVNHGGLLSGEWRRHMDQITEFVNGGGTLVVQEPEFRLWRTEEVPVTGTLSVRIARRVDTEKGGYDTYVFPEDATHPLWKGIDMPHLRWWNGGFGGELVSEHTVTPSVEGRVLASCGLGLSIPAVEEIPHGRGKVLISRIQIRGRLRRIARRPRPYERYFDPVAAQYLLNLLSQ